MNILRAHHVAAICSDYGRSRRFYTEVLGLEIVAEVSRSNCTSNDGPHRVDGRP